MRALFKDIKGLVGYYEKSPRFIAGDEMKQFPVMENAWLEVVGGKIIAAGPMSTCPKIEAGAPKSTVVKCTGRYIIPSWCDSHSHLVYANDRSGEFLDRLRGLSYEEIAAKGGGILNSARALQKMPEDELFDRTLDRLLAVVKLGVGALEIKSGYGLTLKAERKILRVIKRLKAVSPIPLKATFLGCHAVPSEFENSSDYTTHVIEDMLPLFKSDGLLDYVDAFCETGYFSIEDTERLMVAASALGIKSKIHVNQFNILGGVNACVNKNALSVDHLEVVSDDDIEALKASLKNDHPTFPVALPLCSHFLGLPYTPGRKLIDAGLPLTLATDQNPGTAPSGDMTEVVKLGSLKMGLEPLEAIAAATINGAAAMELSSEVGTISPGKRANFILTREMKGLEEIPYRMNEKVVEKVYVNGEVWIA
ncbi:MAG TPA: imidazolonepropionase [Flavobacteriales bacterium]|nr:imidazolonepropionase [Flavobacteriales bacterium]